VIYGKAVHDVTAAINATATLSLEGGTNIGVSKRARGIMFGGLVLDFDCTRFVRVGFTPGANVSDYLFGIFQVVSAIVGSQIIRVALSVRSRSRSIFFLVGLIALAILFALLLSISFPLLKAALTAPRMTAVLATIVEVEFVKTLSFVASGAYLVCCTLYLVIALARVSKLVASVLFNRSTFAATIPVTMPALFAGVSKNSPDTYRFAGQVFNSWGNFIKHKTISYRSGKPQEIGLQCSCDRRSRRLSPRPEMFIASSGLCRFSLGDYTPLEHMYKGDLS
jgi:hypothetical protein